RRFCFLHSCVSAFDCLQRPMAAAADRSCVRVRACSDRSGSPRSRSQPVWRYESGNVLSERPLTVGRTAGQQRPLRFHVLRRGRELRAPRLLRKEIVMIISNRIVLVSLFLFFVSVAAVAQPAADPSGHWEGTIHAGTKDVAIEVDLAKRAKGDLAGTFGNPAESGHGFPLSNVKADAMS